MKAKTASNTAERITIHRAIEVNLPEEKRVCNDPYAGFFLPDGVKKRLNGYIIKRSISWVMNHVYPGLNGAVVSRVRFMDDVLVSCICRWS